MKNSHLWQPSKYVYRRGKLAGSRDRREVAVSSRLITDIVAACYAGSIPRHVRGKLLDLGCGKVPLYAAYKDFVTDNTCVDWANSLHRNEYLDFECDLTRELPFGDGAFDTIILSDVLEHIPEPQSLWSEMSRVLAPNGRILLNVPFLYWLHEQPHDYYRYTEFALRRFADLSRLKLLELSPVGGAPEVLADILAKSAVHIPFVGGAMAVLVQYLATVLFRSNLEKRVAAKIATPFPIGYFLVLEKRISP